MPGGSGPILQPLKAAATSIDLRGRPRSVLYQCNADYAASHVPWLDFICRLVRHEISRADRSHVMHSWKRGTGRYAAALPFPSTLSGSLPPRSIKSIAFLLSAAAPLPSSSSSWRLRSVQVFLRNFRGFAQLCGIVVEFH